MQEEIELEFGRKKSQNGIAYKNNNDVTKTIRVGHSAWRAFSDLAHIQSYSKKELFEVMLSYYVEHCEALSKEQESFIKKTLRD